MKLPLHSKRPTKQRSPPAWEAWIETPRELANRLRVASPPAWEAWIETTPNSAAERVYPADIEYIALCVLELVYTTYELRPFAEDMGYHGEPFRWNAPLGRRAQIRAELDATTYARLYGLTRDELRYILDPKEVHGGDFPGETFTVLKVKEIRLYGEYRTRRLILATWDDQG